MALTQEQTADRTVGHPGTHLRSWSIAELFVASVMDMSSPIDRLGEVNGALQNLS